MSIRGKAHFGNKTSALMGTTDDIVSKSKQAREDAMNIMIESNLMPGWKDTPVYRLEAEEDVEAFYRSCVDDGGDRNRIIIYRLERAVVEQGHVAGAMCGITLAGIPKEAHGQIWLSFDGWADDPRELFNIPIVVEFCRGLLFTSMDRPQMDQAKRILTVMYDEDATAYQNGVLVNRNILDAAGAIWLCSIAFKDEVYHRDPFSPSGWSRHYDLAFAIREWLMGRAEPPTG